MIGAGIGDLEAFPSNATLC